MMTAPQVAATARTVQTFDGARGLAHTLRAMRECVQAGRLSPKIRQAAINAVFMQPAKDDHAEIDAVFRFVRDSVRYVKDVHEVETISSAEKTLEFRYGDCDDQTVLLASLLESIGYPTRFVVAAYQRMGEMEHVYLQVFFNGQWIDCDPTENGPLGYAPPAPLSIMFENVRL